MIEGGSGDRSGARTYAYRYPEALDGLIEVLAEATTRYLVMQARAGAQVLKMFESWAENLPEDLFERLVTRPHAAHRRPGCAKRASPSGDRLPARGAAAWSRTMRRPPACEAVALGRLGARRLGPEAAKRLPIQGALDPLLLRAGGAGLDRRVEQLLRAVGRRSLRLQPRPRHPAGHADRPRRAGGGPGDGLARRMSRIAVVLFNLGGPDKPGGREAVPVQPVRRSGDHRPAGDRAPAAGGADLDHPRASRPGPTMR